MHTIDPSLSPRFIAYIRDFLLDNNLNPDDFFKSNDISIANNQELSPSLPISYVASLFEYVATTLNRPFFGIDLAKGFHYETSSMIVLAMLSAPNVGTLINTLLRYDKYVDSAISVDFTMGRDECCLSIELLHPKESVTTQLCLYLISFLILSLQKTTVSEPQFSKLVFIEQFDIKEIQKKLALEDTEVEFSGRKNQLFFKTSYLKAHLYSHNSLLHEVLCTALDKHYSYQNGRYDIIDAVGREILIQSKTTVSNQARVACALNMSQSTLRRLLTGHGTTFKQLRTNVTMQRAKYYLTETKLSISQIAYELGYSEPSSFSRAFKVSSGVRPDSFRSSF